MQVRVCSFRTTRRISTKRPSFSSVIISGSRQVYPRNVNVFMVPNFSQ
jgi:hypothetical protein